MTSKRLYCSSVKREIKEAAMASSAASFLVALFHIMVALQVQARITSPFTYVSSPPYTHAAYTIYTPYPPPPHHHPHLHKAPQLHSQTAVVTGHVFCDICKNGQFKEPLKGVTIGVTCWNGKVEQSYYGITNQLGNFKVKLSGYNLHKHGGGKSCRAKLIYPSFRTACTLPTNLHDGKLGAPLRIKSKTPHKLVLFVGPFAYTTTSKAKKCHHRSGRLVSSHKHKTGSSHSYIHSSQYAKHQIPSCPIYDCKSKIPPSYNLEPTLFLTQLRKNDFSPLEKKYKALSPQPQSFNRHSSPIYFTRNKDQNSHKKSH